MLAAQKTQLAARVALLAVPGIHLGVLDHARPAARAADGPGALPGRALRQHLARHLRAPQVVEAEEERVEERHQGVVHLVVREEADAAVPRATRAAPTPRGPGSRRRGRRGRPPRDPGASSSRRPSKSTAGIDRADEEVDVVGGKPEAGSAAAKSLAAGAVGGGARHHQPGHRAGRSGRSPGGASGPAGRRASAPRPDRAGRRPSVRRSRGACPGRRPRRRLRPAPSARSAWPRARASARGARSPPCSGSRSIDGRARAARGARPWRGARPPRRPVPPPPGSIARSCAGEPRAPGSVERGARAAPRCAAARAPRSARGAPPARSAVRWPGRRLPPWAAARWRVASCSTRGGWLETH